MHHDNHCLLSDMSDICISIPMCICVCACMHLCYIYLWFDVLCFQRRKWARLDLWEWIFLAVSILNITVCIILSTLRFVNVVQYDPNSPDFIFAIMLIVNSGMYCKTT